MLLDLLSAPFPCDAYHKNACEKLGENLRRHSDIISKELHSIMHTTTSAATTTDMSSVASLSFADNPKVSCNFAHEFGWVENTAVNGRWYVMHFINQGIRMYPTFKHSGVPFSIFIYAPERFSCTQTISFAQNSTL